MVNKRGCKNVEEEKNVFSSLKTMVKEEIVPEVLQRESSCCKSSFCKNRNISDIAIVFYSVWNKKK